MAIKKLYKVKANIIIREPEEIVVAAESLDDVKKYLESNDDWKEDTVFSEATDKRDIEVIEITKIEKVQDCPYAPDALAWNEEEDRPLGALFYSDYLKKYEEEYLKAFETNDDDIIQAAFDKLYDMEKKLQKKFEIENKK